MSKIALIIGGTGGLGRATAELLAQRDCTVIVAGRNADKGAEVVSAITSAGGTASFLPVDLADRKSIRDLHSKVKQQYSRLDIAVNAAGVLGPLKRIHEITADEMDAVFDINITGFYLSMQEQVKIMLACRNDDPESPSKHHIVNLASIYGTHGCPYGSAYSTSKHAVIGMTRSLGIECAKQNIYVNALAPGVIPTGIIDDFGAKHAAISDDEEHKWFKNLDLVSYYPAGRLGSTVDVARAVAFVVENDWMVGSVMQIDGGYSLF